MYLMAITVLTDDKLLLVRVESLHKNEGSHDSGGEILRGG